MVDYLELSELLAVKLCHDLSGPIGAVNNGVELLKEGNEAIYDQAIDLTESSAKDAVARVMFFRQAYGVIKGQSVIDPQSIREISDNYLSNTKVKINWDGSLFESEINGNVSKAILNVILFVSKSMIYGGIIEVKNIAGSINIRGEGKTVATDEEGVAILSGDDEAALPMTVKNVQAYFMKHIFDRAELRPQILKGEDFIEVVF